MDEDIRKQTAIGVADAVWSVTGDKNVAKVWAQLKHLPSADVAPVRHDSCDVCDGIEDGDTLYIHSEWDGGIGFDYIHDIHFCPKCGRRLPNFESGKDGEQND